jgi:hypothetical protein
VITSEDARKSNGNNEPMDIKMTLMDDLGNLITGATVSGSATDNSGSWSGALNGSAGGVYSICDVGAFDGNNGGGVQITIAASKAGYQSDSVAFTAGKGDLSCP